MVEWRGDFYAIEGSHRLAAAFELELIPVLVVNVPDHIEPNADGFWENVKVTLPHYAWLRPITPDQTDDTSRPVLSGP